MIPLQNIALPIGISFYTFQILSYLIDLYRGDIKVQKNILNYKEHEINNYNPDIVIYESVERLNAIEILGFIYCFAQGI